MKIKERFKSKIISLIIIVFFIFTVSSKPLPIMNSEQIVENDNFLRINLDSNLQQFEFEGRVWVSDIRTRGDGSVSTWLSENQSIEYKTPLDNNGIFYMGEILNLYDRYVGFYTNITADNLGSISFSFECRPNSTDSTVTRSKMISIVRS